MSEPQELQRILDCVRRACLVSVAEAQVQGYRCRRAHVFSNCDSHVTACDAVANSVASRDHMCQCWIIKADSPVLSHPFTSPSFILCMRLCASMHVCKHVQCGTKG